MGGEGGSGSEINIGHRVYSAALNAPGEKAASTACYSAKSGTGIGVGVGVADAHEVRHPIIAHSSCIWGVVFFFSFFFPVLNLGRFGTGRVAGTGHTLARVE